MQKLIASLLAAAEAAPSDVTLRLHLVDMLTEDGQVDEAVRHCGVALSVSPSHAEARATMRGLLDSAPQGAGGERHGKHEDDAPQESQEFLPWNPPTRPERAGSAPAAPGLSSSPERQNDERDDDDRDDLWAERVNVTLADIGGMDIAKERLEAAVLAPMRNPELRRLYRQSRTGGVLLYGPPGCGKTFLARATAGELDARYLSVNFGELDPNAQADEITAVFQAAREQAPVVLCLVGIEHLGDPHRSAATRSASGRGVTVLAAELDKGPEGNLGVTIMGSTNAPWDVDPVLRRPGRFEQALLVLPPDRTTREIVLRQQLGDHPEVDIAEIARRSSGYSGRDIAAAVRLAESRATPVTTADVNAALANTPLSSRIWLETAARELALMSDPAAYVGLHEYLNSRGMAAPSTRAPEFLR